MKKICVSLFSAVLVLAVAFSLCSCFNQQSAESEEEKIKAVMTKLQTACNELDVNGMLDCVDPDEAGNLKLAAGAAGLLGKNNADILKKLISKVGDYGDIDAEEFFSSVRITVNSIKLSSDSQSADVAATVTAESNGETKSRDVMIACVQKNGNWYAKDFALK